MYDSIRSLISSLNDSRSIVIISVLGIVIFFFSLFNGFVGDDNAQIVNNPAIYSISNILNFFTNAGTFYGGDGQTIGIYFRPVTVGVHSIIYSIFGPNPFGFHLFKLILFIANASILYLIFKKFFSVQISLFLALLFLLHPLNSENALYISAIQDNLFLLFGLLGMWSVINYKTDRYIIISAIFFLLSLFSKETGVLFILAANFYVYFSNRKIFLKVISSSVLTVFIYGLFRMNAVSLFAQPLNAPIAQIETAYRLLNIPSVIFLYMKVFLFPFNLSSSYQWAHTQFNFMNLYLPLISIFTVSSVLFIFGIYLFSKKIFEELKIFFLFILILISSLFMHSQIIPLDFTASERWASLPMIGVLGLFGIMITIWSKNKKYQELIVFFSIILLLVLSIKTFTRTFDWKDNITLATKDIKVSEDAYDLQMRIGHYYLEKGDLGNAKKYMDKSVELYPYITNLNNKGVIELRLGELEKAEKSFLQALGIADYYITYENLGSLYVVYGDSGKNIEFLKNALSKYPNSHKLWIQLAIIEYKYGLKDEAKIHISNAMALDRGVLTSGLYDLIMKDLLIDVNTITGEVTAKDATNQLTN
jgi:protein O-mannosyl-transferase